MDPPTASAASSNNYQEHLQQKYTAQVRPPNFSIWAIGHGWEGTASDWTEYVFLTLGFLSLVFWLHTNNPSYLGEPEVVEGETGAADEEDLQVEDPQLLEDKGTATPSQLELTEQEKTLLTNSTNSSTASPAVKKGVAEITNTGAKTTTNASKKKKN
ncbi:unnamed protein product [Amoebophrya sp. A120]|nr:unnamed protein product [Amoebophrya sp. A120]|eukprot:GSA120T00014264001.1